MNVVIQDEKSCYNSCKWKFEEVPMCSESHKFNCGLANRLMLLIFVVMTNEPALVYQEKNMENF